MAKRLLAHVALCVVLLVAASINMASACPCEIKHPQTQYCQADFVIVATVMKVLQRDANSRVYKLDIEKGFRMTPKARILKKGRLVTSGSSSLCGVDLSPDETYLIAGNVRNGQAYINQCNYITRWADLTVRQMNAFMKLYRQGCSCEVKQHCRRGRHCAAERRNSDVCVWETSPNSDPSLPVCQANYGICMKNPSGECDWSTDIEYRQCMKTPTRIRNRNRKTNPEWKITPPVLY